MPLYEYRCLDCQTKFDLLRAGAQADASARCPRCAGMRTQRALSLVSILVPAPEHGAHPGTSACGCGGSCGCGKR